MTQEYYAECISCGVEEEFSELDELQEAIHSGEIGEYLCSTCLDGGQGVIVDE